MCVCEHVCLYLGWYLFFLVLCCTLASWPANFSAILSLLPILSSHISVSTVLGLASVLILGVGQQIQGSGMVDKSFIPSSVATLAKVLFMVLSDGTTRVPWSFIFSVRFLISLYAWLTWNTVDQAGLGSTGIEGLCQHA